MTSFVASLFVEIRVVPPSDLGGNCGEKGASTTLYKSAIVFTKWVSCSHSKPSYDDPFSLRTL